jgi:hypothetical protein
LTRDNLLAKYLSGPRRLLALPTLALGAAVIFSGMYFVAAIPRVFYPYDLDFIEDGLLMTALRVANGQAVFLPPNAEFVPHVYMPLYTWLGGLLFKVTGPGFAPLRLLSLTATIATAALIYGIARRESNLPWVGPACAGLFLGGYRIVGFWYELARVDSLYMMLVLAGLALASPRPSARPGGNCSGSGLIYQTDGGNLCSLPGALPVPHNWPAGLDICRHLWRANYPAGPGSEYTDRRLVFLLHHHHCRRQPH